ncbi:hypothetical protein HAX54_053380, partial [Datura stramonium]|nr:hypothetical protein [Datura stramonium]
GVWPACSLDWALLQQSLDRCHSDNVPLQRYYLGRQRGETSGQDLITVSIGQEAQGLARGVGKRTTRPGVIHRRETTAPGATCRVDEAVSLATHSNIRTLSATTRG